jgi:hypothetical protein
MYINYQNRDKNTYILYVHETRLEVVEDFVEDIWGSSNLSFSFRPSVGESGGIFTM